MLFTVSGTFSDFAVAYEQYDSVGPEEALASFLLEAPALSGYDQKMREFAAGAEGHRLIHVADGKRGLWAWHLTVQIENDDIALYGGSIVQTDPLAQKRDGIHA
jgi:hypothetical protein